MSDDDRPTVDLGPRPAESELDDLASTESLVADPPAHADPVHALPTQQLAVRRPVSGTMTKASESRTAASPAEAMRNDEVERMRVFLKVAIAMCVGGTIISLSSTGDAIAQGVVVAGSVGAALGSLWILALTRDVANYDAKKVVLPALPIVFGSMTGVYYWGIASPVAAMLVYGIYFFSLGANRTAPLVLYLVVAVLHGALAIGIMSGLIVDRGVIRMSDLALQDQIGLLVVIEFLYLVAFFTARRSQRVTLEAMSNLEQAVRGIAQREALLAEARAELDRALKVGGPGRFSEQTVGSYRLGMLIGRGGMGEVYEAHHRRRPARGRGQAPPPGHARRSDARRSASSARRKTAARLDCPYVVHVLEVGTTAGEIPFLAMERLRGYDLAHQLRRQRRLGLPAALLVANQVAQGLEAARDRRDRPPRSQAPQRVLRRAGRRAPLEDPRLRRQQDRRVAAR